MNIGRYMGYGLTNSEPKYTQYISVVLKEDSALNLHVGDIVSTDMIHEYELKENEVVIEVAKILHKREIPEHYYKEWENMSDGAIESWCEPARLIVGMVKKELLKNKDV